VSTFLSIERLELAYGQVAVCRDISLRIDKGEIVALIGANGAGKSTTLRAIAGTLAPRRGSIMFCGRDVTAMPSYERTNLGIALVPEGRHVFPFLTVNENLEMGGFKSRKDAAKIRRMIDAIFAMFPRLSERRTQNAGTLSGGEQQMLAIARTLMGNPIALLLDEPSEGLAPIVVQRIAKLLRYLRDTGATVLLAEQNMHFCLGIASEATVIDKGKIVYRDTIDGLKSNDEIRQRYLAI